MFDCPTFAELFIFLLLTKLFFVQFAHFMKRKNMETCNPLMRPNGIHVLHILYTKILSDCTGAIANENMAFFDWIFAQNIVE